MPEIQYRSPKDLNEIPTETGCYIFKASPEKESRILYVGKAKNLRNRVRQYFTAEGDGRKFCSFIRTRTEIIEYILVASEDDALLLENELIKKFKPLYNISLKDDRRYLNLRLDLQHEWPKIDVVRKIKKDGAIYMGPFSGAMKLRETLHLMQELIPLRSCSDTKLYNRSRPCIEYDIKRCVAPCVGLVTKEAYSRLVEQAIAFLKGDNESVVVALTKQMERAAEEERYEDAATYRDRLRALQEVTSVESEVLSHKQMKRGFDCDAVGFAMDEERFVAVLLFVRGGMLLDQRTFDVKHKGLDRSELERQFLERYYGGEVYVPKEVLVPEELEWEDELLNLNLVLPRTEDKKNFVDLARRNALAQLESKKLRREKMLGVLEKLKSKLGLSKIPESIDCFDISHHQGEAVVASVVRFRNGIPEKDFYRKMKLHTQKVDDFESMREAVSRRYKNPAELPDLILIDGGKGQLSAAEEVLRSLDLFSKVMLISLAKARVTNEPIDPFNPMDRERVFLPGQKNPVLLEKESAEELLLSYIRDEAHRFAITYHRKKKLEGMSASILDQVSGLSPKQKIRLLKEFGDLDGIRRADDYSLLKIIKPKALANLRQILPEPDATDEFGLVADEEE